jgi:UPF0755 protein
MKRCILAGTLILLGLAGGWLWLDYRSVLMEPVLSGPARIFEIAKGATSGQVARHLREEGFNVRPFWFRLLARMNGTAARIRYGEYEIPSGMTLPELLVLFASGKVHFHAVTFVEGWTFRQALNALHDNPAIHHTLAGTPLPEVMTALGLSSVHPEGQFFPDTYFFAKGGSDRTILLQAYARMHAVLEDEWRRRDETRAPATPEEALILASIVEKETAVPEERSRVAGVFLRRLRKGMLLQTDPTVIYGMGDAFTGDIRSEDLRRDTPYNTYLHSGLPPTPIALPGRSSLNAVLHPGQDDSLYFVARGDGSHVFSATLDEHTQAVTQWQKGNGKK